MSVNPLKKNVVLYKELSPQLMQRLQAQANVTLIDKLDAAGMDQLRAALPHAQGILGASLKLDAQLLDLAPHLEAVASVSVGVDNYDIDYMTERKIQLTNTPDVLTETTADTGFALILASARRVVELANLVRNGQWKKNVGPEHFGTDVHGKTLGIVGMGNIGAAVARRGRLGFNMPILYSGNSRKTALEQELGAQFRSLDQLLAEADFVCLVVPLSEKTRHLISQRELKLMKPSAILVNISRGPVVDEPALIEALQNGTIRGAGLDVYEKEPLSESPLFALKNAVTLPHIGSATHETREAMANRALANLRSALLGERPQDLVNPQVFKG